MPLPLDKDRREDLLLRVEELRDQAAYKAVVDRLQTQLQNTQRELESVIPLHQLRQLQGKAQALKSALRALDDIEAELKRET